MRVSGRWIPLVALTLLVGCSSIRVSTDWDPKADFGGLERWDWAPETGPPDTDDPRLRSGLLHDRIRAAVEDAMRSRGYMQQSGAPDFLVTYHVATDSRLEGHSMYESRRYRPDGWLGGDRSETRVYEYEVGSLVLDVLSADGKRLLWRGTATARLADSPTPQQRDKRIREAVDKLLNEFPPKKS